MTTKATLLKLIEECFWIDSDGQLQYNYKEDTNLGESLGAELNEEVKKVVRKFKLNVPNYETK